MILISEMHLQFSPLPLADLKSSSMSDLILSFPSAAIVISRLIIWPPLHVKSVSLPLFPTSNHPSALSVYLYNKIFSQLTLSLLFRHQKYWKQGWKGESREESWPHKMELNLAAAASTRPLISWLHSFLTLLTSWHDRNVYLALLWRPSNGRGMLGK